MRQLILLAALTVSAPAMAGEPPARAARPMVVAAHPLAAQAGLDMLRRGGSAADAAVAAQMVLSVVEPHASGLGGGALALHWDAQARRLLHLEGLAAAPATATAALAVDTDGGALGVATVARAGRAVGVPGAVALLGELHARHGRLPWADLFAPAIAAAQDGFARPPYLQQVLRQRAGDLARRPALRALLLDAEGRPPPAGTTLRNPDQAAALRLLARMGPAAIHGGPLGAALLDAAGAAPVPTLMTIADLAGYRVRERDAVCATVFARRVCGAAPPASGGVAVLQMLALLDRLGIAREAPDGPAAAHLFIEASRLVGADRRRWVGDPDFVAVPVDGLLDPGYVAGRAALVAPLRAMVRAEAGDPPRRHGALPPEASPIAEAATTHLSVIDAAGNAIAFTTTNNLNFGADLLAAGFVLNNALTNFAAAPGPPASPAQNRMQGGKRPATTMAPTIVFGTDGTPEIVLGAGGGARIIDAVAMALVEMLAWDRGPQQAVARPRIGAQTGTTELEDGTAAAALLPALQALGHAARPAVMNTGLQVLRRDARGLEGAADPRRDGAARGD
jgi:gamma-glutamyltranspeptidase/glutathione hydrolase